jgi:hypothetical protein
MAPSKMTPRLQNLLAHTVDIKRDNLSMLTRYKLKKEFQSNPKVTS